MIIKINDDFIIETETECKECGRVFDLQYELDEEEFYFGHDCEKIS